MNKNLISHRICDGVNFNAIKDTRFKTERISVNMFLPLDEKTAAKNAILPFLLSKSCKKYPDLTKLNRRLSELYGATIHCDVSKIGDVQALTISGIFLDDRYALEDDKVSENMTKLICDLIFEPLLVDGTFSKYNIEQEKRQLVELIDSEYNDKRVFAKLRCEQLMCKNERFGISRFGKREEVLALTPEVVYSAWQNALETAKIEIMALGDINIDATAEVFRQAFLNVKRKNVADCETEIVKSADKVSEYKDIMDVSQSKLVLGFRTKFAQNDKEVMATRVMAALYGATPNSKLFLNVREKLSLCYYCSARYDKSKGIMMVQSGVEKENIEKAKLEIIKQLEEIKKGNFQDSELEAIKKSLCNSFRTIGDLLSGLENLYLSQVFDDELFTPEQYVERINAVTKEQVIDAAKATTLDTVYELVSK